MFLHYTHTCLSSDGIFQRETEWNLNDDRSIAHTEPSSLRTRYVSEVKLTEKNLPTHKPHANTCSAARACWTADKTALLVVQVAIPGCLNAYALETVPCGVQ